MKAVYLERLGGPEVMKLGELPDPKPKAGEVLVDIHAASINGADWKVRTGADYHIAAFPYVLGRDFSGLVTELGPGVTDLKVGDPVFAVLDVGHEGTYCEKVAIKSALCARKPDTLSHVDAAAIALIGLTAIVAIEDTIKLKRGETILIHGGAGGVASFAIQLAKHIGARVITTASAANHDYVRQFGADQIIDYRTQDFTKLVSGVDAVLDTVGGDVAMRSFEVVRSGGRAAFISSGRTSPPSPRPDVASLRPKVDRDRPHLERILELLKAGAVRVPEVTLYTLEEARAAQAVSEGRHLRGKLVFKVR